MEATHEFSAVVDSDGRGREVVPVPFDPDEAASRFITWAGTVNELGVRAVVEPFGGGFGIVLGAAWRRDCGVAPATSSRYHCIRKDPNATTSLPTSPPRSRRKFRAVVRTILKSRSLPTAHSQERRY